MVKDSNIFFEDGFEVEGTPGLWELITLEYSENFSTDDIEKYWKILEKTNSYQQNNDPKSTNVKSSSGYKYNNVIRPLLIKKQYRRIFTCVANATQRR